MPVSYTHLAARDEERVAFCWQLLQPEAVVFAEAAAIEEAGRGERAVQLDVPVSYTHLY